MSVRRVLCTLQASGSRGLDINLESRLDSLDRIPVGPTCSRVFGFLFFARLRLLVSSCLERDGGFKKIYKESIRETNHLRTKDTLLER